MALRHLLLNLDSDQNSPAHYDLAIQLAAAHGAHLTGLYVRRPRAARGLPSGAAVELNEQLRQAMAAQRAGEDQAEAQAIRRFSDSVEAAGVSFDASIGRDPRHRQRMSSRAARGKPALTHITAVTDLGGVSLVRVRIATGRTHQIRVHLSEAGFAVCGDALYGAGSRTPPARLSAVGRLSRPFLHAARLAFGHPATGEPLTFESPLPADLQAVLDAITAPAAPSGE